MILASGVNAGITQKFQVFYGGNGTQDGVTDMAVTSSGIAYVVGSTEAGLNLNMLVVKYNDAGTPLAAKTFDRAARDDEAVAVKIDSNGNVYVLGYTKQANFNQDITLLKYDANLTFQWAKHYDNNTQTDDPIGLVIDASNNIYVVGNTTNTTKDIVILKYDTTGALLMTKMFNGAGNSTDEARAIAYAPTLNAIYVCGYERVLGDQEDFLIAKFATSNLALQWEKSIDGGFGATDVANCITVNPAGEPIAAGGSSGAGTDTDIEVCKLTTAGAISFNIYKDGGFAGADNANAIAMGPGGDIYVGGRLYTASKSDMAVIKYNSSGAEQWVRTYTSSFGTDVEEVRSLTVDSSGIVYATGVSLAITTLIYTPSGVNIASIQPSPAHSVLDRGVSVGVASGGRIFVAGNWYKSVTDDDITLFGFRLKTTVTGQLNLDALAATGHYPSSLTVDLRSPGTQTVVDTATFAINTVSGALSGELPVGNYDLSVKYRSWLRRTQAVSTTGVPTSLTISMNNGDASTNNAVDLFDLNQIFGDFATTPGMDFSDVDGNGTVDLKDLTTIFVRFGNVGDQ